MKIRGQKNIIDWMDEEAKRVAGCFDAHEEAIPEQAKREVDYQIKQLQVPYEYRDFFKGRVNYWYRRLYAEVDQEGIA